MSSANQVLDRKLVEAHEPEGTLRCCISVEVFERGCVSKKVSHRFTCSKGGCCQLKQASLLHCCLNLRVLTVGLGLRRQKVVGLHVGFCGVPHALNRFGAAWLVVKVTW